mmetsp:Transcript_12861/g.36590  ORF Transcript_12861/g.36590 Transcript_12861/m.36590 type:complete len:222 (-) Transcript_12861:676-1341(-)
MCQSCRGHRTGPPGPRTPPRGSPRGSPRGCGRSRCSGSRRRGSACCSARRTRSRHPSPTPIPRASGAWAASASLPAARPPPHRWCPARCPRCRPRRHSAARAAGGPPRRSRPRCPRPARGSAGRPRPRGASPGYSAHLPADGRAPDGACRPGAWPQRTTWQRVRAPRKAPRPVSAPPSGASRPCPTPRGEARWPAPSGASTAAPRCCTASAAGSRGCSGTA